jgi:probable DNA repair protein
MHEEIFRAAGDGATVITASRRLARVLTREFHQAQTMRGHRAWDRPDILPLDGFVDRLWRDWLWRGTTGDAPLLLNDTQEQALWERIIYASDAGASLLQVPATARKAAQSWRDMVAYRLPLDGSFEASEDTAAFAAWSREFRRLCGSNGWMERARLSDFLREKIMAEELPRPPEVYTAGFDEMTPQQTEFLNTLGRSGAVDLTEHAAIIEHRKLRDASDEFRSAAVWARRLLESDLRVQVGIIVAPDLERSRAAVERSFRRVLDRAVHLSVGPPLRDYPLVRCALLMLDFASGPLTLSRAGMLLRSPFLEGAEEERSKRALLDVKLRKRGLWDIGITPLRDAAGNCSRLQKVLRRVEKRVPDLEGDRTPAEWSRCISDLLDAFGWPGDRTLNSVEFQTVEAWRGALSNLASIDVTTPAMNFAKVIDWLGQTTADTQFQPEDEGAPVQVMGMLEAAGLRFDHLWIMGLHDEALPAPVRSNPFLPARLQQEFKLPHSSPSRELEFANKLMSRLLRSAPDIVLSYPEREGDRALAPSPLVAGDSWLEGSGALKFDPWIENMRSASVFERIADEAGPQLEGSSGGGASLFKDMAACPFRAFAKHRLGARPLEDPDLGLSYRDRGSTVHKALEFIWRELGSHARLMEISSGGLESLISQGADVAVASLGPGIGRDVEKRRLQRLLHDWLELEKLRSGFTIAATEAERVVSIAGLQVKLRADRVDELPNGRQIILDYKTGLLKKHAWDGDRPDEPQLPLYCVTNEQPVAGVAFALVRTGDIRFRGLMAAGITLPNKTKKPAPPAMPFDRQLDEWRRVLDQLAANYRMGRAEVDPNAGACDNCGLRALCRIRELEPGVSE